MLFVPVFVLSSEASLEWLQNTKLNDRTLYEQVKRTSGINKNAQIDVGGSPDTIVEFLDKIYVTNPGSDSISVINASTYTKIKDIPVGDGPSDITMIADRIFVTNSGSDTLSVISRDNYTKIEDIKVGNGPSHVAIYQPFFPTEPLRDLLIYVTNFGSDSISVINASTYTKIKDISVGDGPSKIVSDLDDTFYIANLNSDSISVINASTYTKIKDISVGTMAGTTDMEYETGEIYVSNRFTGDISVISGDNYTKIKDIPVGYFPTQIEAFNDAVYVANEDIGTISLISRYNHTLMKRIPVGSIPEDIAIHREQSFDSLGREILVTTVYVANYLSDNVSVISGDNYTKIKDIPVGANPKTIAIDGFSNTVYVANEGSNSISVIDGVANKAVAGVTFRVNPFNSGHILCNELTVPSPIEQYVYVYSGDECTATPNEGFEFVSWEENLEGNSTQPVTVSKPASSLDSLLDFLGLKPQESEARINIIEFGTFTANFKELPPAIPPEYIATLFTVVITAFIGSWLTPTVVTWRKTRNDARKMNYYHRRIASLEDDGRLDENDIEPLGRIRHEVVDTYSKGRMNENQYENLRNEIAVLYEKIYRKSIDSINNSSDKNTNEKQLDKIKKEIEYAYSEGKITELHYNLLNKKIDSFVNTNKNKTGQNKLEHANKTGVAKRSPL